jgi:Mor family transcriptional regulator
MSRTIEKLTRCEIQSIWKDFQSGTSYRKLVEQYDITLYTARKVISEQMKWRYNGVPK